MPVAKVLSYIHSFALFRPVHLQSDCVSPHSKAWSLEAWRAEWQAERAWGPPFGSCCPCPVPWGVEALSGSTASSCSHCRGDRTAAPQRIGAPPGSTSQLQHIPSQQEEGQLQGQLPGPQGIHNPLLPPQVAQPKIIPCPPISQLRSSHSGQRDRPLLTRRVASS